MNSNGDVAQYFDDVNKRLDIRTEEVVDLKTTAKQQQATQLILVSNVEKLVTVATSSADRLADFEIGATVELENVDFIQQAHTLRGNIRRVVREQQS
jgi:hypothetical protein